MFTILTTFRQNEDGAVTVDWVVLTAALLTLGIAVAVLVTDGATDMSTGAGARLADATVPEVTWN